MLDAAFTQPLQDLPLRHLRFVPERVMNEAALFSFSAQSGSGAQVSLIGQHDQKFRLLTVSRVFHYPEGDLLRSGRQAASFAKATAPKGDRRSLLVADARRSDSSYCGNGGCNE